MLGGGDAIVSNSVTLGFGPLGTKMPGMAGSDSVAVTMPTGGFFLCIMHHVRATVCH